MYIALRKYKIRAGSLGEIARRAEEGFVPLVSQIPGFISYYGVDAGNDIVVTISIFQDQAGEEESTRRAANWVRQNVAEFVEGGVEVTAGEVRWSS